MTNAEQKVLDAILEKGKAVTSAIDEILFEDVANKDFLKALQIIYDNEHRAISDFLELMNCK